MEKARVDVPVEFENRMSQLMLNLTENAIKYGRPHGHVELSAQGMPAGIEILVCDDGMGIPKKDLPHVFKRFYRADAARDRSGTGLGLSIAQWIVQAHVADIQVSSQQGQGTVVKLIWPSEAVVAS